ncbi:hypothetical protein MOSE0_H04830 [Monosporozyma servazzii]
MGLTLTYAIKFFSQYSKDIPITNGVETQMCQLDMSKWLHFPTRDKFMFQLCYYDNQLIMTVMGNNVHVLEQFSASKQDIELKRVSHIQFSIKSPTISCKYLKLSNNILVQRRFQMTLENKQDFDNLVHLFTQVNIIVKNAKVLNDNTLLASQISTKPYANQLPCDMDNKIGISMTNDNNTTLLETQIGEPVNLNLGDSSFAGSDTFYSNSTHKGNVFQTPNRNIPIETGYQNVNTTRQVHVTQTQDNIIGSTPMSINNNNISTPINPHNKLQPRKVVENTVSNLIKPPELGKLSTIERVNLVSNTNKKILPSANSYDQPILNLNTICLDDKVCNKPRQEDQNMTTLKPETYTNIMDSCSKPHKFDHPKERLNSNPIPIVKAQSIKETMQGSEAKCQIYNQSQPIKETMHDNEAKCQIYNHFQPVKETMHDNEAKCQIYNQSQPIKETIQGNEAKGQPPGGKLTTQGQQLEHISHKKKSKKKIHITRKLIKAKLKDKKFRKWVCIQVYHFRTWFYNTITNKLTITYIYIYF